MTSTKPIHSSSAGVQPHLEMTVDGITYESFPVKVPRLIEFGENLDDVLKKYLTPYFKKGDWIVLSEKLVSVCQNRVRHISTVQVTWLARLIVMGVKKHKNMTAWSRPEKIQVAIEEAGVPRIILAMILGGIGKLFRIRGIFWIVAGNRVSEIDGFIPEDMYPYTEWAVLPATDPEGVCAHVEKVLNMPAVIVDANYINVKVLGISGGVGLDARTTRLALLNNPLGQGNKMTPFVLVRSAKKPASSTQRSLRSRIKKHLPWPLLYVYRKLYYFPKDVPVALAFLFHKTTSRTTFFDRFHLIWSFYKISYYVDCPHTEHELLTIARRILNLGTTVPGIIVEAGAFHGGSTAKLSLVAKLSNRNLAVFDSFEGMPANSEMHGKSIFGREHHFPQGSHSVGLEEVRDAVRTYGDIARCQFHKGWLNETLPLLKDTVAAACINVDLEQSTKDCIHYLYPLMSPGGILFSQDAHFPWIIKLLQSETFWSHEVGIVKPVMEGLGFSKLVPILIPR